MTLSVLLLAAFFAGIQAALASPVAHNHTAHAQVGTKLSSASCFPALGFEMPWLLPQNNTHWWCDTKTEYAFVGFSYEVTACQSPVLRHIL